MAFRVENSPFTEQQVQLLNELIPHLSHEQRVWLNGYLSAKDDQIERTIQPTTNYEIPVAIEVTTATILYASQTGNSQKLAESFAKQLEAQHVDVHVSSMSSFKPQQLKKLRNLLIVASTQGEGEAPDNGITFHEFLHSKRAPKLADLHYAVLALGDSSYEFFCQTGIDFDERLRELGATALIPRVDCDLDYEEAAATWFQDVRETLLPTAESTTVVAEKETSAYSKTNPFQAEVIEKINLNMDGSNKETYHVELSLENSNLTYVPGDSLGIIPHNEPQIVERVLDLLQLDRNEDVQVKQQVYTLQDALTNVVEITVISKPLLQKIEAYTDQTILDRIEEPFATYKYGKDLVDILEQFGPFSWTAQQFVDMLRPIPARLYSIASSLEANEEEVHLTIGKVAYESNGRKRLGVASGEIAERIDVGDTVSVFVQTNENFKLPEQDTTPIIMIGAGTGIAPFRSFVEERAERNAQGKSWLFFGEQHFMLDFLYQVEWLDWLKQGDLTKMDVAFSRDQEEKIYVQHKLREHGAEVYDWLEQGAVVYVCGDEKTMAKDVHEALRDIIIEYGQKTDEEADDILRQYQQNKQYQRDVY